MISEPLDWVVGTHGIEIEFKDPETQKDYYGTYLPNIPPQNQGWDQLYTV